MRKIVGVLFLLSGGFIFAMDKSDIDATLAAIKTAKEKKHSEKLEWKMQSIKQACSDQSTIVDDLKLREKGQLYRLYSKDAYAPLLKVLIESKKLNPDLEWCETFIPVSFYQQSDKSVTLKFNLLASALHIYKHKERAYKNIEVLMESCTQLDNPGSDPLSSGDEEATPLQIAVGWSDQDLVKKLLARKVKVNIMNCNNIASLPLYQAIDIYGQTRSFNYSALPFGSEDVKKELVTFNIITLLLAHNADPALSCCKNGKCLRYPKSQYKSIGEEDGWCQRHEKVTHSPLELAHYYDEQYKGWFKHLVKLLEEKKVQP